MLRPGGVFVTVGIPEEVLKVRAGVLLWSRVTLTGSMIGSIAEITEMLEFAAKHNIRPIVQKFPMNQVKDAIKTVRDGTIRYRAVLINEQHATKADHPKSAHVRSPL